MRVDVVELWVRDLGETARTLTTWFGFEPDHADLAPRADEEVAVLRSGDVSFILRRGTCAESAVSRHVARHGNGVGDVALVCDDPDAVARRARAHGSAALIADGCARIDLLCDGTIVHSVRTRSVARGARVHRPGASSMRAIDHVTYCLPSNIMDLAVGAYREVFGLEIVPNDDAADVGGTNGMRSAVLRAPEGFTVVLTAPNSDVSDGQTQHFLHEHAGPGVQHVAIAYDDLIGAVEALRSNGALFLPVPPEHFERSHLRLQGRGLPWEVLRRHGIVVDADDGGLLFQLFTRPIMDRSSFFLELIHRAGAIGFGPNNVRALFAAVDAAMRTDRRETL